MSIFLLLISTLVLTDSFRYNGISPLRSPSSFHHMAATVPVDSVMDVSRVDAYISGMERRGAGRSFGTVIGSIVRWFNMVIVSSAFFILLRVLNRLKVHNVEGLNTLILKPREMPLLSVSNHQSFLDDPGLWAAILPFYRIHPDRTRWGICTEDVFFAVPWLQPIMGAGNALPLDRGGSLFQPAMKYFWQLLNGGAWCHVFPEGRLWQDWRFEENEPHLGPFKVGVGKLIAHCEPGKEPIILPMYHTGMDKVIPEKQLKRGIDGKKSKKKSRPIGILPCLFQKIDVYVGEPFDLKPKVAAFREMHPGILDEFDLSNADAMAFYSELTNDVREKVLELEKHARRSGPKSSNLET